MFNHVLFGLLFDSSKNLLKALAIVTTFLSFKGITHPYFL